MYGNIRRRLSLYKRRNTLTITIAFIIVIYLTLIPTHKIQNQSNISLTNLSKIYLCPQLVTSLKGYFRIDFTENFPVKYSSMCKSNDLLLIYILSATQNFERRQSIRRTWANKSEYQQLDIFCFTFIVGLSTNNSHVPYNGDVALEASIYRDIVQLNLTETYENVPYKEVGALKWSYIYASHIPFLFKTDDDLIVDTLLLSDVVKFFVHNRTDHSLYIQKHTKMQDFVQAMHKVDKYTLFRGHDFGGTPTLRSGKFGVHEFAWNADHLPAYCSGFGFIYSSFIRDRLYRASLCYARQYVPLVGDVFVSGFLAGAASVRCSGWPLLNIQAFDPCSSHFLRHPHALICSTPLHLSRAGYLEFDIVWQVILGRHPTTSNRTSTTTTTIAMTTTMNISSLSSISLTEATRNFTSTKEVIR